MPEPTALEARRGEYKGHPTLSIVRFNPDTGKEYVLLTFGLNKAEALIECMDEIESFVREHREGRASE